MPTCVNQSVIPTTFTKTYNSNSFYDRIETVTDQGDSIRYIEAPTVYPVTNAIYSYCNGKLPSPRSTEANDAPRLHTMTCAAIESITSAPIETIPSETDDDTQSIAQSTILTQTISADSIRKGTATMPSPTKLLYDVKRDHSYCTPPHDKEGRLHQLMEAVAREYEKVFGSSSKTDKYRHNMKPKSSVRTETSYDEDTEQAFLYDKIMVHMANRYSDSGYATPSEDNGKWEDSKPRFKTRKCRRPSRDTEMPNCYDENYRTPPVIKRPASKSKRPILWKFILRLLSDSPRHDHMIHWVDKGRLSFKIRDTNRLAAAWGIEKHNPRMTYSYLSRSLRLYKRPRPGVGMERQILVDTRYRSRQFSFTRCDLVAAFARSLGIHMDGDDSDTQQQQQRGSPQGHVEKRTKPRVHPY